jgi:membrane associated rhomboid family serine protease
MDTIVWIIIGASSIFSVMCWRNPELFAKYQLNAYKIFHAKQYIRVLSHAFMHANWAHLLVNMLVLWSFGKALTYYFSLIWGNYAVIHFLLLYFFGIIASSVFSIIKHKDNPEYNAVGASGATSAVVFACMFFEPWRLIYFFGIIPIPGIVFGALYLIYSYRMSKQGNDNIGHDAHFWGALFGFVYPMIAKPQLIQHFIYQLTNFNF